MDSIYMRLASGRGNDGEAFHVTSDRDNGEFLQTHWRERKPQDIWGWQPELGTEPGKDLRIVCVFTWSTESRILHTKFPPTKCYL